MQVISINSRLLTKTEQREPIMYKDLMAIIFALQVYEFVKTGSEYPSAIFSDHRPLVWLFSTKIKPSKIVPATDTNLPKLISIHKTRDKKYLKKTLQQQSDLLNPDHFFNEVGLPPVYRNETSFGEVNVSKDKCFEVFGC